MPDLINLNRARKARAKAEKDKTAQANRVLHGTPKVLRKLQEARKEQADQRIAGQRLENERDDN